MGFFEFVFLKVQSKMVAKAKCNQKWLQKQNAIKNDCKKITRGI